MLIKTIFLASIATATVKPNQFECKGENDFRATYSVTSFAGIPILHFQQKKTQWNAQALTIKIEKNFQGKWVTGITEKKIKVSMLLSERKKFSSILIIGDSNKRQLIPVKCESQSVVF